MSTKHGVVVAVRIAGVALPYFSGGGGVTLPGGNALPLGSTVSGWSPDLRKSESRMTAAVLVKFDGRQKVMS
jgi:hypothetical protein